MVSDKFRRQLRQEVEKWQAEGLISSSEYRQFAERYDLDGQANSARNRFIAILIGLGTILLAIGAIALFAAYWQAWSRELKVTLLLSLFMALNISGFYLWRIPPSGSRWPRELGQRLLILGALLLGANMALVRLIFNIGGSWAGLLIGWGLGVLVMSYSLRLAYLGIIAILLIAMGYWPAWFESASEEFSWLELMVQHAPLVAGLLFIPLAYWCRSRTIFVIAAIALIGSLELNLWLALSVFGLPVQCSEAIALALPPSLLWSYDDSLYLRHSPSDIQQTSFRPFARAMALLFLVIAFYILSFRWFWFNPAPVEPFGEPVNPEDMRQGLLYLLDVLLILGGWVALEWRRRTEDLNANFTSNAIATSIAIAAFVRFWHQGVSPIGAIATLIFNALLFFLAAGLIREGLALGRRVTFWGGMVLLTLQIFTRLFEYDTSLLLKAFGFVLCGSVVTIVGLWCDRYLHNFNAPSISTPRSIPRDLEA